MAKKKNSVALFEVISKGRRSDANLGVPGWMGKEPPPAPPVAAPGAPPRPAERPAPPVAAAPAPARLRVPPAGAPEPVLTFSGDRIRLSLNYVSCAVAVLGLFVLLVGSFSLGWWSGGRNRPAVAGPGGGLDGRVPLGRHVLGGPDAGRGRTPGPAVAGTRREDGKYYLVIQSLQGITQGDLAEAQRIAEFCKTKGEPSTIGLFTSPQTQKKRYIVWSLTPFDSDRSNEAKAYALKVEQLGSQYFEKSRTYNFLQRKRPGADLDPWFEPFRAPAR